MQGNTGLAALITQQAKAFSTHEIKAPVRPKKFILMNLKNHLSEFTKTLK